MLYGLNVVYGVLYGHYTLMHAAPPPHPTHTNTFHHPQCHPHTHTKTHATHTNPHASPPPSHRYNAASHTCHHSSYSMTWMWYALLLLVMAVRPHLDQQLHVGVLHGWER